MLRKGFSTVALLFVCAILFLQARSLSIESHLEPTSDEVALARAFATKTIPLINEFKKNNGTYPCHLNEVLGSKSSSLGELGRYQAISNGYFIYVANPGGTPAIFWGRDGYESGWVPCTHYGSCPPGEFSDHCCGREKYPKCELYIDSSRDK